MARHRVVSDYTSATDSSSTNIKVFVRARPPDELVEGAGSAAASTFLEPSTDGRRLSIKDPDPNNKHSEVAFQFDRVIWTGATQSSVFDIVAKPQIDHVLRGYNACCFAYGQTGSGKTYSMFGEDQQVGMVPRAAEYIFGQLASHGTTTDIVIGCSFLEIYLDNIRDLAKVYVASTLGANGGRFEKTSDVFNSIAKKRQDPYLSRAFSKNLNFRSANESNPVLKDVQDEYDTMNLAIHEDIEGNVFVKDLCIAPVSSVDEVMSIIQMGLKLRATHETKMNTVSSRSHTVFTIHVLQSERGSSDAKAGMLNLVDLAGSERLKRSESQGQRLKEALHINSSLTCLGKVVMALDPSADRSHVPYRESKLTRMLQNSLGGNSYTVVLAAIHPNPVYYEECLSTLQFANRCRNVRNNPRVNYVSNTDGLEDNARKVKRMQEEISTLRMKLAQTESGRGFGGMLGEGMMVDKEKETTVFSHRVAAIMQKLNMECTVGEQGSIDLLDGRRLSSEEVQDAIANGNLAAAKAMGIDISAGVAALFGAIAAAGGGASYAEVESLRAQNKELSVELRDVKDRLKDRKLKLDEAERNNKLFEVELNRLKAGNAHNEFENAKRLADMEKCYQSAEEILKNKQEQELKVVIAQNQKILVQNNATLENIPKALRRHTDKLRKTEEVKFGYEDTMKGAFQKHLTDLEEGRVAELAAQKQQYEYWLGQKDKVLADFVAGFNTYRTRKSGHLRSCEREMADMLAHIERSDNILKNVENGRYFMQHKHNILPAYNDESAVVPSNSVPATGGTLNRSGGVTSVIFPRGQVLSSAGSSRPTSGRSGVGEYSGPVSGNANNRTSSAGVVKTVAGTVSGGQGVTSGSTVAHITLPVFKPATDLYPLATRISLKFKRRRDKEDAARSEAVDQALYRAKDNDRVDGGVQMTESTYIPEMDQELQEYVRGLLVSPSKDTIRMTGNKTRRNSNNQTVDRANTAESNPAPPSRPKSAVGSPTRKSNTASSAASGNGIAPTHSYKVEGDAFIQEEEEDYIMDGEEAAEDPSALRAEIFLLRRQLGQLQASANVETLNTRVVIDALKSDETLQYIRNLEQEKDNLHDSIRQLSSQLQNMKVANQALTRSMTIAPQKTRK